MIKDNAFEILDMNLKIIESANKDFEKYSE